MGFQETNPFLTGKHLPNCPVSATEHLKMSDKIEHLMHRWACKTIRKNPQGNKEEHLNNSEQVKGQGNGNPLQYSCLENPRDRGAWWAAVYGVTQSQTRLKWLTMHACNGEGNGNPLQCSCLENPRDRGAWWATVHGVAQSQTRLKQLSSSSSIDTCGNRIVKFQEQILNFLSPVFH